MSAGSSTQQQQQAVTSAQPAMPLQGPSSEAPLATPTAQAGQATIPFPLLPQAASRPAAHWLSTGPSTSAMAASDALQASTASQTPDALPSGMLQQPQGSSAEGPNMGDLAGQPANPYGSGSAQQPSLCGQQQFCSSNPDKTSNGMHAVKSMSSAVAEPEQPQPTQSSSAGTDACAISAAGCAIEQEAPDGVAVEMLNKARLLEMSVAAVGADKAVDTEKDASDSVVHQSALAKGDVT